MNWGQGRDGVCSRMTICPSHTCIHIPKCAEHIITAGHRTNVRSFTDNDCSIYVQLDKLPDTSAIQLYSMQAASRRLKSAN